MNTACETFSNSIAQVENLELDIRHFLISGGDKALTYEKTLSKLSQDIADFEERWNNMNASMNTNNDHLKHISDNITSLKNDREVVSSSYIDKFDQKLSDIDKLFKESAALSNFSDYRPHYAETTNQPTLSVENRNSNFTLGPSNERIIHSIPKLDKYPTKNFTDYTENILPNDLRSSICQFLEEYSAFSDKSSHKIAYFGQDFNKRKNKTIECETLINTKIFLSEAFNNIVVIFIRKNVIPKPILEAINLLHQKFSTPDECNINSVHVIKFLGKSSHLKPQIAPRNGIRTVWRQGIRYIYNEF